MDSLTLFILIAIAALLVSAWAHLANDRKHLARSLYVIFSAGAALFIVVGAAIAILADPMQEQMGDAEISASAGYYIVGFGAALGLPLLRPVRRGFARFTSIDPGSVSDMVGLIVIAAASLLMLWTITIDPGDPISISEAELVVQALMFVVIAYFGVGGAITRDFRSVRARLGLAVPTGSQVLYSLLLIVPIFAISIMSAWLTQVLQPEFFDEVGDRIDSIAQDMAHLRGALILGISAGVGEETLFRGAIQPRYGIILTSLLFSLIHIQYGLSFMLLGVFLTSVVLGIQRKRMNTTACIITHAAYNFCVIMISTI